MIDFADARLWSETTSFNVRVIEVAQPKPGDRLIRGDETFVLQGEPFAIASGWSGR